MVNPDKSDAPQEIQTLRRICQIEAYRGRKYTNGFQRLPGESDKDWARANMFREIAGFLHHQTPTPPKSELPSFLGAARVVDPHYQRQLDALHTVISNTAIALGGAVHDNIEQLAHNCMTQLQDAERNNATYLEVLTRCVRALVGDDPDPDAIRPIDCLRVLLQECEKLLTRGVVDDKDTFSLVLLRVQALTQQEREIMDMLNRADIAAVMTPSPILTRIS